MIQEIKIKNFLSFKEETTFSFEAVKAGDKPKGYELKKDGYNRDDDPLLIKVADDTYLLRFAAIFGANAAGKTNLLTAINFLFGFMTRKSYFDDFGTGIKPFALDDTLQDAPSEFNLKFYIDGERYWYQLIINKDRVINENLFIYKSRQPSNIFRRNEDKIEFNQNIEPIDEAVLKQLSINCLKNMSLLAARKTITTDLPVLDKVVNWIFTSLTDIIENNDDFFSMAERILLENPEIEEHLIDFLHKADFNISKIETEVDKKEIPEDVLKSLLSDPNVPEPAKQRLMKERSFTTIKTYFYHTTKVNGVEVPHRLPSSWQSRGTKCVFSLETLLYMLEQKKDNFVSIDEMEKSLHPDLMDYIMERFLNKKGSNSQLLITSHYAPLMDLKGMRKDCIWFAEKDRDTGNSTLTPLYKKKASNRRRSYADSYLKTDNFNARPEIKKE